MSATQTATLAGGCFWCLEAVFERLEGVESVVSGFAGGREADVTYREVCEGGTGHAEVVRLSFDPAVIPYDELLAFFFAFHDPTTMNRQGADVGTQYRSAIYWETPEQRETAEAVVAQLTREQVFASPIVTEIAPLANFVPAEEDHQGYFRRNASQPYCQAVIAPKVAKLRARYQARLKKESGARSC